MPLTLTLASSDSRRPVSASRETSRDNPQAPVVYYNRGLMYHSLLQYERAIQNFYEAIRLDPQHPWAYNNRSALYGAMGTSKEAARDIITT
jgi:tetratricopeptide (TPR) repeat protein